MIKIVFTLNSYFIWWKGIGSYIFRTWYRMEKL